MKTNVTMKSQDRNLFGVTIRQGTNPAFMSVTDLQQSYETARWQHGWSDRKIQDIVKYKDFQERLYHLLTERNLIKVTIITFTEMLENEGITKTLKGLKLWKTTGRGTNKMVMCDPYIWTLLAMELNPLVYAKVVIWLTDSLIFDRIDAGNKTKPLNHAISGCVPGANGKVYGNIYRAINTRVFGMHLSKSMTGGMAMRDMASSKELRKIADIEKFMINAIKNKWVKNEQEIVDGIGNYV